MNQSYHISEEQFVRACWYSQVSHRRQLIGAMFLVLVLFPAISGFRMEDVVATAIAAMLLLLFLWLGLPRIHRWRMRRIYRNNPLIQREQNLEMQPTGLILRSSNGESRYHFSELKKVSVLEDMVLVYPTTTIFHMIPVNLLSDFELAQFRALA